MDTSLPATETDAALVADADGNRVFPDSLVVTNQGTLAHLDNYRSQFRILDGGLYRITVDS